MSFGESVFSGGFIQKTSKVDPMSEQITLIHDEIDLGRL
jgi:Cu/Ag efflux protein CusF